ncbi:MAG: hypothetical protein DPW16_05710 [Chloroflexi bacterium]|nr:hypothetical protein [Chloroflexota bacterium]
MAKKLRGLTSNKRHGKKTHRRWRLKFGLLPIVYGPTCTNCRFFVAAVGVFPVEWGVCANPVAERDGLLTVADYGCRDFEMINGKAIFEEMKLVHDTHERWAERELIKCLDENGDNWNQCLFCRFYIPLEGHFIDDWGLCTHPESPHDGTAKFEHEGCEYCTRCVHSGGGPTPRAHLLRLQKKDHTD